MNKMRTHFCHFCGHGPVAHIQSVIKCSDCHAEYIMGRILVKPTITEEEADVLFTKKELTERQRTGKSGSKRWKKRND